MTLKNNRALLLSLVKLYASSHHHMWIQTRVTVWKRLSWVVTSVTLTLDLCPWPFAWTSLLSLVITPENFMMIGWWEHSQKGVTDRRTDWTIHRAAWSQLKTCNNSTDKLTLRYRIKGIINLLATYCIEPQLKWPTLCWLSFQFFFQWDTLNVDQNFNEVCFHVSKWQYISIASESDLVPVKWQATDWYTDTYIHHSASAAYCKTKEPNEKKTDSIKWNKKE